MQKIKGKITRFFNQVCSFPRTFFFLLNQEIEKAVCVCVSVIYISNTTLLALSFKLYFILG